MPGARRTAQSVLVVAVPVGALLRELPACGRGPADLVAAPSPEGSRPSGLGMPPAPESARCLPTPSGFGTVLALARTFSRGLAFPRSNSAVAGRPGAPAGRALEAVEKVVTGILLDGGSGLAGLTLVVTGWVP